MFLLGIWIHYTFIVVIMVALQTAETEALSHHRTPDIVQHLLASGWRLHKYPRRTILNLWMQEIKLPTYLTFVKALFKVTREIVAYVILKLLCKVWVKRKYVRKTFHVDALEVTIGQRPYVTTRYPNRVIKIYIRAEEITLSCRKIYWFYFFLFCIIFTIKPIIYKDIYKTLFAWTKYALNKSWVYRWNFIYMCKR